MAKVIFVNRFFYPDQSATSQLLTDLAFFLAEESHDVHVITSGNMVAGKVTQLRRDEIISKVRVHRVGRSAVQSRGLISPIAQLPIFLLVGGLPTYRTRDRSLHRRH